MNRIEKDYYCQFCDSIIFKYAEHLKKHKDVEEVAKVLDIQDKSKRRKEIILLNKQGQFIYFQKSNSSYEDMPVRRRQRS